ncbi:MAG: hypothetical protein O3A13_03225 [Proteobacteria bacterium]|nr:hypothetical protein [Pseudomonadota bacterium]MDA0992627.1 hypothetical protein [Pseudomonadota bacterium]
MKVILEKVLVLSVLLLLGGAAIADTTVRVVYICTINEGKSIDDVRAANSAWVKFVNANVAGAGISSTILTPIVGDLTAGRFIYTDSYPNVESWSAATASTENGKEGMAIQAALEAAGTCASNSLYNAEVS